MRVTAVVPDDLGASEAKQWRELQAASRLAAHPCYSLTYARILCRADEEGRVALVEEDGKIRAFLPYTTLPDPAEPQAKPDRRTAGVLGGGQTAVDGLISDGEPLDLAAAIRKIGLRGYRFSRAPLDQQNLDRYRYQGSYHEKRIHYADLRAGYDAYLASVAKSSAKEVKEAARRRRALERAVGEVSFEWNSRDPADLAWLLDRKSEQFESIRAWLGEPANRDLVRELADSESPDCAGLVSVLRVGGGKPLGVCLNLRRGPLVSGWLTGYDPEFAKFAPGTITMLAAFAEAASRGVHTFDFGYGDDPFKRRFASAAHTVGGGGIWASRVGGAARALYRRIRVPSQQRTHLK